jgi:hypothetical protein
LYLRRRVIARGCQLLFRNGRLNAFRVARNNYPQDGGGRKRAIIRATRDAKQETGVVAIALVGIDYLKSSD